MREHKRQLRLMLQAWRPVAWTVRELGGCIAWEWPRDCALWRSAEIQEILQEYGLEHARFDGCSYGVKCRAGQHKGLPILKPWSIVTDCPALWRRFSGKCCPGKEVHPFHAPCAGADTAASGYYTRRMAVDIHKSWLEHCAQRRGKSASSSSFSAGEICVECDTRSDGDSRAEQVVAKADESGSTRPSGAPAPGPSTTPEVKSRGPATSGLSGYGSWPLAAEGEGGAGTPVGSSLESLDKSDPTHLDGCGGSGSSAAMFGGIDVGPVGPTSSDDPWGFADERDPVACRELAAATAAHGQFLSSGNPSFDLSVGCGSSRGDGAEISCFAG